MHFRRLSPEEMADKRKKGECYFCLEKFSLEHKCASKGVFLMELEDDDDLVLLADELGVSLHALTSLASTNCRKNKLRIIVGCVALCLSAVYIEYESLEGQGTSGYIW
jgi:hypothetical protein